MPKKWIITDLVGNLPTTDEAEALRRALTQEKYTQKVWSATSPGDDPEGPLSRCEWGFEDGLESTLVDGLRQGLDELTTSWNEQVLALNRALAQVGDLKAELSRRPTLIDVIKSTYRMVRG